MTGRRGREAIEVTTGDTGALPENEARIARTDEDGIDHDRDLLENTEVKRLDTVKGHLEGNGQDRQIRITDGANHTDLTERKSSPNQRNMKRSVCRKQRQK
jgi:hypothetical protein